MKKYAVLCALLSALLLVAGCTGKMEKLEIDVNAGTAKVVEALTLEDELLPVTTELALEEYQVEAADVKAVCVYMSSGATSEEISLWEAVDSQAAARLRQGILDRVERQTQLYASYRPEEARRLEGFVLEERGNYLLLIVAKGDTDAAVKAVFP